MTGDGRREPIPASLLDRVVARGLDLLAAAAVFGVVFAPIAVLITVRGLQDMFEPGSSGSEEGLVAAGMAAAAAALIWEPLSHQLKGKTFGKSTVGISLSDYRHGAPIASPAQSTLRYLVSVSACGALIAGTTWAATALGWEMMPWNVLILVAAVASFVWLTTVLSALANPHRRGWHDRVAGTIVVASDSVDADAGTRRPSSPPASGPAPRDAQRSWGLVSDYNAPTRRDPDTAAEAPE